MKTKANVYQYLSRNVSETEESVLHSGSRASVQACSDMVIAANCYIFIFAKNVLIVRETCKSR
jgi:hypothetical protein